MFSMRLAQANDYGLGKTATEAGLTGGGGDVAVLAGRVVGTALSMIGVLFFILMIYGGFLWMTARGNEQQTDKAKQTITAAVIGMIIVLSSYAITTFVFQAVGSAKSCQPLVGFSAADCTGTDFPSCTANTDCKWE
jgi:cbb3-type cytochrome oxidase subunit 3